MTGISLFSVCPQVGVAFEEEREEQSLFPLPNAIFFLYLVCPHPSPPSALFPCMRVTSPKYSLPLSLAVLIVCQGRREREKERMEKGKEEEWKKRRAMRGKGRSRESRVRRRSRPSRQTSMKLVLSCGDHVFLMRGGGLQRRVSRWQGAGNLV